MPVGLHISGELLERLVTSGCSPLQILLAGEIAQFGEGQCYAQAKHFAKRFGRPKSTIVDALKALRDSGIIADDGEVKSVISADEGRTDLSVERTENPAIRTDLSRTKKPHGRTDLSSSRTDLSQKEQGIRSPSKVRNKQETKLERSKNARGAGAEGFAEFYDSYPRKVGKANAEKSWTKLAPSPDLRAKIAAHVAAMSQTWDWQKDGGQFVPHPATYLNQQRWTDELPKGNGAVAMRAPQQSAFPLNAPSTVEPPAPTSTLPAGLTKSAGELAWWAECLGKIADGMDPDFFREYIGCLEIAGISGDTLHLEAPTAYIKGNAVWHCDAIEEATGKQVKIHVRDWSQDE